MVKELSRLKFNTYTGHQVAPNNVKQIACHRAKNGDEQYLVHWKLIANTGSLAVYSWHNLQELQRCLHHVQSYVEGYKDSLHALSQGLASRKRKSPDDEHVTSRDEFQNGLLTPHPQSSVGSRSPSAMSVESDPKDVEPLVYNGILKRKEGLITAVRYDNLEGVASADVLPSPAMKHAAIRASTKDAERYIREAFVAKLRPLRGVSLENKIDGSTPSLNFTFVNSYVLRDGVYAADPDSFEGCQNPCRPDMGQNIGCEYTRECGCLEYSAVDEDALKRQWPDAFQKYRRQIDAGRYVDTKGLPKRFPYLRHKDKTQPATLQAHYRESRHAIYECNQNCNCGPRCKSRLVQKGRRVPLTIFKTSARGWGIYCNEDLLPGEFIDTYLGEVITNEEAEKREKAAGKEKESYLYSLDKFVDDGDITPDDCFVVDGEYMGGPTRFVNHSCEPNCRQYTVSYNKNDRRLYDLAFFAYEHIPAGTELTFDYMDQDEEEEEIVVRRREEAANDPSSMQKTRCLCGARKCRGFLW